MRAVTGSVGSSKRISVSKAAAILSRFAAAETGARRDVAAYLKRASAAFDDLVHFHREVRDRRRQPERESRTEEKEGRRKKRAGSDGDPNPREVKGNPRGRPEKEIRGIREVEEGKEVMEDGGDGNLTELEGDFGGGVESGEDGKSSKKKGVNYEKERSELGWMNEKKMEVEGERKKEEKKRRREMGDEGSDGGGKKRKNLDDEERNKGGGLDGHKKRKKRKIGMEE